MKKKAYMAPATVIITTSLRHIICGSQKVTLAEQSSGNVITEMGDENETPTEADARINKWDDEDEYDE